MRRYFAANPSHLPCTKSQNCAGVPHDLEGMHLEALTVGIGFTRGPSPRNRLPMVLLRCRLLVARITAVVNSGLKPLNGEYVCSGSLGPPASSRPRPEPA